MSAHADLLQGRLFTAYQASYFSICTGNSIGAVYHPCIMAKPALLHSVLFFFLYQSPSSYLYMVFDSVSCNINEFLLVISSANVHHKNWLTYSGGNDRPIELCYKITLLSWLTFLLRFLTVTVTVMLFWIYFFLVMLVFVLKWLCLHCEILIMLQS